MNRVKYSMVVIGGGPAGLAAALEARELGCQDVLIVERDWELGGILQQCIHNGFGLHLLGEELTGGEYAQHFIDQLAQTDIEVMTDTMVIHLAPGLITAVNPQQGLLEIEAGAIVLAMGCRERTRGAISIPGTRPAGVMTAGTAQRLLNMEGLMPGKRIVILGSGDIGLIMARRLTLEGAKVEAVAELMPWSSGLTRNIVQCLDDFDIPLLLSHTVVAVHGSQRLEGVTLARVDDNFKPIAGSERHIPCDTLLLSVGLIPENELSQQAGVELDSTTGGPLVDQHLQTTVPGIFACGNVVHVHDLVDNVSLEAQRAAAGAVRWLKSEIARQKTIPVQAGEGVGYVVPQRISLPQPDEITLLFRVKRPMEGATAVVTDGEKQVASKKLPFARPAEMAELVLEKGSLEGCGEQLEVSVVERSDSR